MRVLELLEVTEAGLQDQNTLVLLHVAGTWLLLEMVGETSFCCLEGQQMALLLMRDVRPDVARQSTALLLFASRKVVSGHIASMAQLDVSMALQWGMLCVMVQFDAPAGAGSVREGARVVRDLRLLTSRPLV